MTRERPENPRTRFSYPEMEAMCELIDDWLTNNDPRVYAPGEYDDDDLARFNLLMIASRKLNARLRRRWERRPEFRDRP